MADIRTFTVAVAAHGLSLTLIWVEVAGFSQAISSIGGL